MEFHAGQTQAEQAQGTLTTGKENRYVTTNAKLFHGNVNKVNQLVKSVSNYTINIGYKDTNII